MLLQIRQHLMGDQIVPVEVIGTQYVINKGGLNAGEFEGAYIVYL